MAAGGRLFNRTTRSVSLPDAGERLLTRLRPAIPELGAAADDLYAFRNIPSGTLRLRVSNVAAHRAGADDQGFPRRPSRHLAGHHRRRPPGDIASGSFDAGIRAGRFVAKDMQIVWLSETSRPIAIATPEHLRDRPPIRRPPIRRPEDLQNHNCIRLRTADVVLSWEFARGRKVVHLQVNGSLVVNTMSLVLRATLDGIGVGYTLKAAVTPEIAAGRLVPLLADWSAQQESYYLYDPGRRQLPVPHKAFIAFAQARRAARTGRRRGPRPRPGSAARRASGCAP